MTTLKNYKEFHEGIVTIVNEIDPMQLIAGGAPTDEYNIEIQQIINEIKKVKSEEELKKSIFKIFRKYFEEELDEKLLKDLTRRLYEYKSKFSM